MGKMLDKSQVLREDMGRYTLFLCDIGGYVLTTLFYVIALPLLLLLGLWGMIKWFKGVGEE